MKNGTGRSGALIVCALIVLGLLATTHGDPLFAQTRLGQFTVSPSAPILSTATTTRFAVIGDFGFAGVNEAAVAAMVNSWNPDFIITVGDNNYESGAANTIDPNIGQYYSNYIYPYLGTNFTPTVTITQNLFFPALGNHDWGNLPNNPTGANAYLAYFTLPGNERYYDFIWGPVHLFALDSDANEPSGNAVNSAQAVWLNARLATSTSKWRLVYMHHPPYSSGTGHPSTPELQWPYQSWGATAVLSGHVHNYERIVKNNFPYFVNGLGGRSLYASGAPISGSLFQYSSGYGAMLVTADDAQIEFEFWAISNTLSALDTYTVTIPSTSNRSYVPFVQR